MFRRSRFKAPSWHGYFDHRRAGGFGLDSVGDTFTGTYSYDSATVDGTFSFQTPEISK
jgi:hypothetical protein